MPHRHLPVAERLRIYAVNFVFNGALGMFLMVMVVWLVVPTSLFFKYDTVEPVSVPVDISKDHIDMVSNIEFNKTTGNFHWNDVLRCNYEMRMDGPFQYIGQSDTFVETSKLQPQPYAAPWTYQGNMPTRPALCKVNRTVTRYVFGYIPKRQFVQSTPFIVR